MARPARAQDVHRIAGRMPHVTKVVGTKGNAVYQVGQKSFVFFRNPRKDALDPDTGERLTDVIVFWVESLQEKDAMVLDESTPYFTTDHFDGHPSVLLRASRIGEIERDELEEVITSAWLAQAPKRLAKAFLER